MRRSPPPSFFLDSAVAKEEPYSFAGCMTCFRIAWKSEAFFIWFGKVLMLAKGSWFLLFTLNELFTSIR